MKMSRKDLERLISEVMAEQRIPGEATARSEQAYRRNSPAGTRRPAGKGLSTARRRRDRDEIEWALRDADGDGDLDLVNIGGEGLTASGEKAETGDVLIAAGILDSEAWSALSSDEHFEDPKFGRKTRRGNLEQFMADLAYDIASGKEQRLTLDQIRKLADLNPMWGRTLDGFDADIADEMRRDEFMQENLNESKETQMSKGFGRDDIKSWFAQTLYEDFETSKPRKRRSTGILTEVTDDGRDDRVDNYDEYLGMISQALVLGLETLFGLDIDEKKEYDLGQDFRQILEKNPDVTNSIARYFEHYRMGDNLTDDDDGMAPLDVAGSDRAEMVDTIARVVYDAMGSSSLSADALRDLVFDMSERGDIDFEMWLNSDIDDDEIRDRVAEFEEENARFTGL